MKRINIEKNIRPVSDFRTNAAALLDYIKKEREPLVITQNGRSSGVLISVADYEEIMGKLEIIEELEQARFELKQGKTISHKQVIQQLKEKVAEHEN
ncbi:MAG: type II toxin-antitoxin system Phd/YefM family antitoxin [Balneolaceae bacterium]|nr:type II toxin-antitoxin system Phd/YefM family antitoxin [Balneolaceae bacterium]